MSQLADESLIVSENIVVCHGEEVPYDHPAIYLQLNSKKNTAICPYCSKKFVLAADL